VACLKCRNGADVEIIAGEQYTARAIKRRVSDTRTLNSSVRIAALLIDPSGIISRFEAMTLKVTSYNTATVGSGSVVNDTQFTYNDFGQLTHDYQSHAGTVNVMSTPRVIYSFADGSDNTIRPVSMSYPNGRVIDFDLGSKLIAMHDKKRWDKKLLAMLTSHMLLLIHGSLVLYRARTRTGMIAGAIILCFCLAQLGIIIAYRRSQE